ncbi:CidA/LrgA family protein [Thalassotalea euphylliae]|uniref:CidA/LrgA family protein n=1 Tax=Thalassotalea euphylliae TaxID=1655234 RepID=A0A3E0TY31_9GAMM|nr:CidA/LrgA family protein [Thalassotalea euphylliae]REL29360.1 CidA/LrgA family protein [Thalassotalea euphylliae]
MHYKNSLYSLAAIFICLALGYLTFAVFDLLPASLYGMCYFAFGLHLNVFDAKRVADTVSFMIKNISVCFVPAGVGIMNYFDLIRASGWQLLLFTIISTFALMIIVGWLYQTATTGKSRKHGNLVSKSTPESVTGKPPTSKPRAPEPTSEREQAL